MCVCVCVCVCVNLQRPTKFITGSSLHTPNYAVYNVYTAFVLFIFVCVRIAKKYHLLHEGLKLGTNFLFWNYILLQFAYDAETHHFSYTVEPLNNGHIGTDHFVHYREVVLFQR